MGDAGPSAGGGHEHEWRHTRRRPDDPRERDEPCGGRGGGRGRATSQDRPPEPGKAGETRDDRKRDGREDDEPRMPP